METAVNEATGSGLLSVALILVLVSVLLAVILAGYAFVIGPRFLRRRRDGPS
jgi:hypothetical protein